MLRIGLTGGMGSGKTTVAGIFEVLGVPVYYADSAAKKLMAEDDELRNSIISEFGRETYNGRLLNRQYLSSLVFSSPEKTAKLNSLVHPVTIRDAAEWFAKQDHAYVIKEAALIFESGAERELDYVIGVSSPTELRISRIMQRDKTDRESILARMSRQMDDDEKIKRCDYILVNNEQEPLIAQVLDLHHKFLSPTSASLKPQ